MRRLPILSRTLFAAFVSVLALAAPGAGRAGLLDAPSASGTDGVLPADQAFIVQPALWDQGDLTIGWSIAPNCYLYRSKISIEAVDPAGYELGPVAMPEGTFHVDEHFGEVEIYRNAVQATFRPFSGVPPKQLRVRYQGCAENKVCYPAQTRMIDVIPP